MQIKREWLQLGGQFFWNFSRHPLLIRSGGGHYNYHRRHHRCRLQSLYWWRQKCNQISDGCLEIFKKIITLLSSNCNRSLFIYFFNLILDAPRNITEARLDIFIFHMKEKGILTSELRGFSWRLHDAPCVWDPRQSGASWSCPRSRASGSSRYAPRPWACEWMSEHFIRIFTLGATVLKVPSHQIRSTQKWYGWAGSHGYKNRWWYTEF